MVETRLWGTAIAKAVDEDLTAVRDHLLRFDRDGLLSRFGNAVTADFLSRYVEQAFGMRTIIFCCKIGGIVRGVGELRPLGLEDGTEAEAALTVERSFRDLGVGSALMRALLNQAELGGVRELFIVFGHRNPRMRRIVQKFRGSLSYDGDDIIGRILVETGCSRELRLHNARKYSVALDSF